MEGEKRELDIYLQRSLAIPIADSVSGETVGGISASDLVAGGVTRKIVIGKGGQIIVNDGTNDRVLIGYDVGGF